MGQLKQQTMIDATEERKNRFTGESVLLTPHEAKIHDDIFINELDATLLSIEQMHKALRYGLGFSQIVIQSGERLSVTVYYLVEPCSCPFEWRLVRGQNKQVLGQNIQQACI